jgi:hypothetical protein
MPAFAGNGTHVDAWSKSLLQFMQISGCALAGFVVASTFFAAAVQA